MGRHEGHDTFGAIADDYVTGRARELIRQFDGSLERRALVDWDEWCGQAAEILRELIRNA